MKYPNEKSPAGGNNRQGPGGDAAKRPEHDTPLADVGQMGFTPRNGAPQHRDYVRLAALGYPHIFSQNNGQQYFIDQSGLLDGRCTFGPNKGHRRVDAPEARPPVDEVHAIVEWFMRRPLYGQKTATVSSYHLKHLARESLGRYVCNGAMILALDCCGIAQCVDIGFYAELNTVVCVSKKSYKYLLGVAK